MKSNYKKIGDLIQLVDERNKDLKVTKLLGVSIKKRFIPSVANIVGTNMARYKIIRKNQFACSIMQVRRDKKIPVALLQELDEAIISQAYPVFEVKDTEEILPEYLMMWMSRSEFDRHACFLAVGGVRGSLEWEDFCDMELPVPTIDKQKTIVKEYNTIIHRILLNEQLNQKLEATAQAIYKHWFVDFEFPDENGKPYKSSGGEMVLCEELDMEIPKGWKVKELGKIIESASKKHNFEKKKLIFFNTSDILNGEFLHQNYSLVEKMPGQAKKRIKRDDILYSEIRPANKRFAMVRIDADDYVVSTKLMVLRRIDNDISVYRLYNYLTSKKFIEVLQQTAEGRSGTFPQITFEGDIEKKKMIFGDEKTEFFWDKYLNTYYSQKYNRKDENTKLLQIRNMFLSSLAKKEKEVIA